MVEMTSDLDYTIREKLDAINGPWPTRTTACPTGTIFQDADQALYHQKNNGRAGCSFYQK